MTSAPVAADKWYGGKRLGGLYRFAIAISILNILGHTIFGFEPAWAHVFVSLAAAYGTELAIESMDAWASRRTPNFLGSPRRFIEFLLPAHITGLAVSMLLYANQRFWAVALAAAIAIASKTLFRVSLATGARRHFLNPSNFGIAVVLIVFPTVSIAPPYQFTEYLHGPIDYLLPLLIVMTGTLINLKFTERLPLILAWVGGFAAQALLRSWMTGLPWEAAMMPMTGFAFVLFTFYMITDPGSTPSKPTSQVLFGLAVAAAYGALMLAHIVFGLFFALAIVTVLRGGVLYLSALRVAARAPSQYGTRRSTADVKV